ncbi:unnamed protein product, partial [Amoebophrya sp. A25]
GREKEDAFCDASLRVADINGAQPGTRRNYPRIERRFDEANAPRNLASAQDIDGASPRPWSSDVLRYHARKAELQRPQTAFTVRDTTSRKEAEAVVVKDGPAPPPPAVNADHRTPQEVIAPVEQVAVAVCGEEKLDKIASTTPRKRISNSDISHQEANAIDTSLANVESTSSSPIQQSGEPETALAPVLAVTGPSSCRAVAPSSRGAFARPEGTQIDRQRPHTACPPLKVKTGFRIDDRVSNLVEQKTSSRTRKVSAVQQLDLFRRDDDLVEDVHHVSGNKMTPRGGEDG